MVDDLFSDNNQDPSCAEASEDTPMQRVSKTSQQARQNIVNSFSVNTQPKTLLESSKRGSSQSRKSHVDSVIDRNMKVMEAAYGHFKQFDRLQNEIFGDGDTAAHFFQSVENRLAHDDTFKARYNIMAEVHQSVVDKVQEQDALYSTGSQKERLTQKRARNSLGSSAIVVPGQPTQVPAENVTRKRNHLLRKDMI